MEFTIQHPNGTRLSFSGDASELDRFIELVRGEAAGLLDAVNEDKAPADGRVESSARGRTDNVSDLEAMLANAGAATDVERIAVMAAFAERQGSALTEELARQWYTEMGLPRPARWRSTFGNTRTRGYIHKTTDGWKPTSAGENLAFHGIRRSGTRRRSRRGADA